MKRWIASGCGSRARCGPWNGSTSRPAALTNPMSLPDRSPCSLLKRRSEGWDDPHLGWTELAAGGLEVYETPGDHVTMLEKPHVALLAALLRDCIDRALSQEA